MADVMIAKLQAKGKACAQAVIAALAGLKKAAPKTPLDELLDALPSLDDWSDVGKALEPLIVAVAMDGVGAAADQLATVATMGLSLDLANEEAVNWAKRRSADLVGMKRVGDEWVKNPNPQWSITDTTRKMIKATVVRAMEEGWSNDKLANAIEEHHAFSQERALNIARTETAMADVAGNYVLYEQAEATGIKMKVKWITAEDDKVSEDCRMNGKAKPRKLGIPFPSGAIRPPEHPRCRCDVLPVVE